jgi:hypothetical protein
MDPSTLKVLTSLPPLSRDKNENRKCKICGSSSPIFDVVDFNKHCSANPYAYGVAYIPVVYYRCPSCQFVFTDFIDDWTVEEVSRFIYNNDYVKVDPEYAGDRPRRTANEMSRSFHGCENLRILDYGSGAGLFASEMAARGFGNMSCYDPFSHPERPDGKFNLITCFEVIEHSPKPMETLRDMLRMLSDDGAILIGQTTQPANIDQIRGAWWYIAPRNGHVSTFANLTFFEMARREGLAFRPGGGLYGFARSKPSQAVETVLARIGPKYEAIVLLAPAADTADPAQWHKLESARATPFRWTASDEIYFGAHELGAGVNRIQIPFVMEGYPGFASECLIAIDGQTVSTRIEDRALVCEITVAEKRTCAFGVRTPKPISPFEHRKSPDQRPLGLAVRSALRA